MALTPTEIKLLSFILKNRNRNRKMTRGSVSREIGHSTALIYGLSKRLKEKEMIEYSVIDAKRKEIKITSKGESYILNLYKN